jgi:hypothetical protein
MLHSIFPRVDHKFLSLPMLGPVADGFDDWLAANGYTRLSRKHAIRMLAPIDADLRRRGTGEVAKLTHAILDACWRDRNKCFPGDAGTVRALERYLTTHGMIAVSATGRAPDVSAAAMLATEYADYLLEVGGFAISTIKHHRYVSQCFLDHLDAKKVCLRSIQASDIETYIVQASKRLSRASLQQEIAPLRGLLRFLAMDGRVPPGLDGQIDTPRLYQPEQLPRALPWDTVKALLRSIDTTSPTTQCCS